MADPLIRGLDFDNDSAFMNEIVVPWCRARKIEVTRSRAYKKNDQAFVEQKNGAIVRRLVGYGRFEGIGAAQTLSRLYAASRLHVNFFQPSFKLREKRREGARVIKRYHAPATPLERALMHPALAAPAKRRLRALHRTLDPVTLLAEMRKAQADLGGHVDRRSGTAQGRSPPQTAISAADFVSGLGKDWQDGERRAIHRRQYVRRKPVPRRPSMIDPHLAHVETWLAAEPHLTAANVLGRLAERVPGHFGGKQLRTVQRLVKAWRTKMARLLIDGAETMIMIEPPSTIPAGMVAGASTTAAAAPAG